MVYQTARTEDETIETVLGVEFLNLVEQTGNHVVTARSLTTTEDNTHVHLGGVGFGSRLKLHNRHTVSVGEQLLDFVLISYTLGRLTFLNLYCTL